VGIKPIDCGMGRDGLNWGPYASTEGFHCGPIGLQLAGIDGSSAAWKLLRKDSPEELSRRLSVRLSVHHLFLPSMVAFKVSFRNRLAKRHFGDVETKFEASKNRLSGPFTQQGAAPSLWMGAVPAGSAFRIVSGRSSGGSIAPSFQRL
jgi:hypothetical protein